MKGYKINENKWNNIKLMKWYKINKSKWNDIKLIKANEKI